MTSREERGLQAVNLGLASNVVLAALKTAVGVLGHSPALLADGINSTSDVAYYTVVRVLMHFAKKPADDEHPYGHSQLESIAALVVGAFVIVTAIAIFWNAVNDIYDLHTGRSSFAGAASLAMWIALATVGAKIVLMKATRRIGRETDNPAVLALADDHRNDIVAAAGAAVGIIGGRSGFPWADPLAGAVVALIVFKTGVGILRDASANLMDAVPGPALDRRVRELLASDKGIVEVEEVLAHRFGPYLMLNVTVGIDGALSVSEGDAIAGRVEKMLVDGIGLVRRVYVHYHPARITPK
jgi:cation diffusion facilitator family transporter